MKCLIGIALDAMLLFTDDEDAIYLRSLRLLFHACSRKFRSRVRKSARPLREFTEQIHLFIRSLRNFENLPGKQRG